MDNSERPIFQLHVAPAQKQGRWTIFFRLFMLIPHFVALYGLLLAAEVLTFLGWFAILFTGKNPFHEFVSDVLRWQIRVTGYALLLTGEYPPFSFTKVDDYPIATLMEVGPMGRASTFFRLLLSIPAYLVMTFVGFGTAIVAFFGWIITLFRGTLPEPLHNAFSASVRFQARVYAYTFLVQDRYPRGLFGDPEPPSTVAPGAVPLPPPPPMVAPESPVDVAPASVATDEPGVTEAPAPPAPYSSGFNFPAMAPIESVPFTPGEDARWKLVVTKPGRKVLVTELIVGTVGYIGWMVVYLALIIPNIANMTSGSVWTSNYRSDVVSLNSTSTSAVNTINLSPTNWSAIASQCAGVTSLVSTMNNVPQYPVAGPNSHLLEGVGLLATAANDCTTDVVPNQVASLLPTVSSIFHNGISQLQTFLNET
ncbi:MAG: DUF4389 domain-containing protein [Acidimicrobiales bacterium]